MFYLNMHSTHFIYGYMMSDIWYSTTQIVRGNPLPPYGLLFLINSKGSFICTYHSLCYTNHGAQWVHPMKDRSNDLSHQERMLLPQRYISLLNSTDVQVNAIQVYCNWTADATNDKINSLDLGFIDQARMLSFSYLEMVSLFPSS